MISGNTVVLEISCGQVREELTNYLEGDVTSELRARIEAHLAGCTGCRIYYDGVREVIRIVGEVGVIELPAGFSRRLYFRLANL